MLYFNIIFKGLYNFISPPNYKYREYLYKELKEKGNIYLYQKLYNKNIKLAKTIHKHDIIRIIRYLEKINNTNYNMQNIIKTKVIKFALASSKEKITLNIKQRFYNMLDQGLEKEVINLINMYNLNNLSQSMQILNYKQMYEFITNKTNYISMISNSILATQLLSKKQLTWLNQWKDLILLKEENLYISSILNHCI